MVPVMLSPPECAPWNMPPAATHAHERPSSPCILLLISLNKEAIRLMGCHAMAAYVSKQKSKPIKASELQNQNAKYNQSQAAK